MYFLLKICLFLCLVFSVLSQRLSRSVPVHTVPAFLDTGTSTGHVDNSPIGKLITFSCSTLHNWSSHNTEQYYKQNMHSGIYVVLCTSNNMYSRSISGFNSVQFEYKHNFKVFPISRRIFGFSTKKILCSLFGWRVIIRAFTKNQFWIHVRYGGRNFYQGNTRNTSEGLPWLYRHFIHAVLRPTGCDISRRSGTRGFPVAQLQLFKQLKFVFGLMLLYIPF